MEAKAFSSTHRNKVCEVDPERGTAGAAF